MVFEYKAKTQAGETIQGKIKAVNQETAIDILTKRQLVILSIKDGERVDWWKKSLNIPFLTGVKTKDMVFLSRQLSTMVGAGLTLVKALEILARQTPNEYLRGILEIINEDVRGGTRFSSALAKYPKVFDNFYINMVRAGETAGKLDEVLLYLADEREKNFDLQSKIKGAMIYPAFVMVTVFGVMLMMMAFVIPQLTEILSSSGVELPIATKVLIFSSKIIKKYFYLIIAGVIGTVIGLKALTRTRRGRLIWDRLVLKIPIFNQLFRGLYLVRFTRSSSTLIVGGIPLISALKIVADVVGNEIYRNLILQLIVDVEEGRSISTSLLQSKHIPKMLAHLLAVGEQTGKLDEVLAKMADFYAREVENILAKLVTLLEPIIIIFLALVVGGMMAAILLPMYKLASAF